MQTMLNTIPTGAIYGIHATRETRAEEIPAIDVERLVGALGLASVELTAVAPQHRELVGSSSDWPLDMIVFAKGAPVLSVEAKVFDATPSTIERAQAVAVIASEILPDPPAYKAFKDLGHWLDADDRTIASMVGVRRTTPYTWKRDNREPRAATARCIYEHHATLDSLRRRLGADGLRRWLYEGSPTRRDALLAGDLKRVEADVHALLFRREPARRVDLAAAPENTPGVETARGERRLRPSGRRPRRSGG